MWMYPSAAPSCFGVYHIPRAFGNQAPKVAVSHSLANQGWIQCLAVSASKQLKEKQNWKTNFKFKVI
jgi:hypothetical protein